MAIRNDPRPNVEAAGRCPPRYRGMHLDEIDGTRGIHAGRFTVQERRTSSCEENDARAHDADPCCVLRADRGCSDGTRCRRSAN